MFKNPGILRTPEFELPILQTLSVEPASLPVRSGNNPLAILILVALTALAFAGTSLAQENPNKDSNTTVNDTTVNDTTVNDTTVNDTTVIDSENENADPDGNQESNTANAEAQEARIESIRITVVDQEHQTVEGIDVTFFGVMDPGNMGFPKAQKTGAAGEVNLGLAQTLFDYKSILIVAIDEKNHRAGTVLFERPDEIGNFKNLPAFLEKIVAEKGSADDPAVELRITLEPMTTIRGQVLNIDDDKPVPAALVEIRQIVITSNGMSHMPTLLPAVVTDEDGRFETAAVAGLVTVVWASNSSYVQPASITDSDYITPVAGETLSVVRRMVPKKPTSENGIAKFEAADPGDRSGLNAFEFLVEQFQIDNLAFRNNLASARDSAEQQLLIQRQVPAPAYIRRMLELADTNRGTPVEAKALAWACDAQVNGLEDMQARYAVRTEIGNRLMKDHIASPEIEACLANLICSQADPQTAAERIINENSLHSIQGKSLLTLGEMLLRKQEISVRRRQIDESTFNPQRPSPIDPSTLPDDDRIYEIFIRIRDDYGDVPYWRNNNLGTIAAMHLFELDHLGVGDFVEDISGMNMEGDEMKLSDNSGKFIVLDFWGSWCGPCIQDLPVLNRISDEFAANVAVVGLMNDSREDAQKCLEEHQVPWPNWVEAEDGPIQTRWNINSWPTTYLIGPDGRIISKTLRGEKLYEKVKQLVRRQNESLRQQNWPAESAGPNR